MQKLSFIIVLILCLLFVVPARSEAPDTTLFLPEASINARKVADHGPGHFSKAIDYTILNLLSNLDLGSSLRNHSAIFVRSYGTGGLATTSIRGGASGQTAIIWNGVNLNSPMNGQTDLSLIPSFFFDQVVVQHGGSSAMWGSSAMGGAVFLNNAVPTNSGFNMRLGLNAGSQGELGQSLRASYSSNTFSSTLRLFHRESDNHYRFPNFHEPDAPTQKQQNAAFGQLGIMHDTRLKIGRLHQLDLQWWWLESSRNLSPPTNFPTFLSRQDDLSLRMHLQYTLNLPGVTYYARVARVEDRIEYSDVFTEALSYKFVTLLGETEVRWVANTELLFTGGINLQNTRAEALEYQGNKDRNIAAVFLSALWTPLGEVLRINASARKEMVSGSEIPIAPSLGINLRLMPGWHIKGNASYSFRLPSLNDMYWIPGGNPNLKPEDGWNYDLHIEHIPGGSMREASNNLLSRLSIGGYWREIQNWIVWLPQADSWLWMPENRAKVRSYGLEALASGSQNWGNTAMEWNFRYEHSIARNVLAATANDLSVGRQLMYVPRNRAGLHVSILHQSFSLSYSHDITGKSYTNSDNSQYIPGFNTGNISISKGFALFNNQMDMSLSAENIWNQKFQIVAHRPMPFRIIRAGINIALGN